MRGLRRTAAVAIVCVSLTVTAFGSGISLDGTEIGGETAKAAYGAVEKQITAEKIYDNADSAELNMFPLGYAGSVNAASVKGHVISSVDAAEYGAEGKMIKAELTDDISDRPIETKLTHEGFQSMGEKRDVKIVAEPELLFENGETAWYTQISGSGGSVIFQHGGNDTSERLDTYLGCTGLLGCKLTPSGGKNFKSIKWATVTLITSNINVGADGKFHEVRYLQNETGDKYISFGIDCKDRRAYYSIDGNRVYVPESVGWYEYDGSGTDADIHRNNLQSTVVDVSFGDDNVKFSMTGTWNKGEREWTDSIEMPDLAERVNDTYFVEAIRARTDGHAASFTNSQMIYTSDGATGRFAFGYGKEGKTGGKGFGITAENIVDSSIKMDIKTSDAELWNGIRLNLAYSGNKRLLQNGKFISGSGIALPDKTDDEWQTVEIPLADFSVAEDFDLEKLNLITVYFGDGNVASGKSVCIRNVRAEIGNDAVCDVEYMLYDSETNRQITSLDGLGGKDIYIAVAYDNAKTYDEEPLFVAALYKNGIAEKVYAYSVNAEKEKQGAAGEKLLKLPENTDDMSIGVYLIHSFKYSRPYGGGIFVD